MTAFTDARVTFWSDEQPLEPSQVAEHDFVFVPHTSFAALEVSASTSRSTWSRARR
jgi:hypothetical protein